MTNDLSPEERAARSVTHLTRIELADQKRETARAERNYAILKMDVAEMEAVFARWASRTGKRAPGMNARSLERWLKEYAA